MKTPTTTLWLAVLLMKAIVYSPAAFGFYDEAMPAPPATPGDITGLAAPCPNKTNQVYSIDAVVNATSYTWTVPAGWSIDGGQGTLSITVTTGNTGQNGDIEVIATNGDGSSSPATLSVAPTAGKPNTPGAISGTAASCPLIAGQVYSISPVANATTYSWTIPIGWTITTGQGTVSLTVTSGSAGDNGNISVVAGNTCGVSAPHTFAVTVNPDAPLTPGNISGASAQCPSTTNQIYSINPINDASSYTWAVPAGWTITAGQGSTSITVTTGNAGQNGSISVTASNSCGISPAKTKAVTVGQNATIALTSLPTTTTQTLCVNTAINNIVYTVGGGGSSATVTGLPTGVHGTYNSGTKKITISGTPTVSGTFNYTVNTTGSCTQVSATGTITVNPNGVLTLTSSAETISQTLCKNDAISDIVFSVTGNGTGATVAGLPSGVMGAYNAGYFTISGTPTVTGSFNYTVTTTSTCQPASSSGTLAIHPAPDVPVLLSPNTMSACHGAQGITAVVQHNVPDVDFIWDCENPDVTIVSGAAGGSVAMIDFGNAVTGTAQISVTAENEFSCTAEQVFPFVISSQLAPEASTIQVYNSGVATMLVVLNNDPTLHFEWGRSARNTWIPETLGVTTQDYLIGINFQPALYYYWVKITDSHGCETISFLEQPVSIDHISIEKKPFLFFPNPCHGQLSVYFHDPVQKGSWNLFDMQGKWLKGQPIENNSTSLICDMTALENGWYVMKINTENFQSSFFTIVLQK